MDYEHIKQGELPRTWSDILGGFGCGEIKRFPLEGQALTNARHAIPRMGRKGLKFRTRSKGDHFYILCTAHQQDGAFSQRNSTTVPEPRTRRITPMPLCKLNGISRLTVTGRQSHTKSPRAFG